MTVMAATLAFYLGGAGTQLAVLTVLFASGRERWLLPWIGAALALLVAVAVALVGETRAVSGWIPLSNGATPSVLAPPIGALLVVTGLLFAAGAYRVSAKQLPLALPVTAFLVLAWIAAAGAAGVTQAVRLAPVFLFAGATTGWSGILVLRRARCWGAKAAIFPSPG